MFPKYVYRSFPQSGEIVAATDGFVQQKAMEFSPDMKTLYVSETGAAGVDMNLTRPGTLYAFDVINIKNLAGRRTFAYAETDSQMGCIVI